LTAAELAARHGLRRVGREWRGPCPACGYKTGLTLTDHAGTPLWRCMSCGDQAAVTAAILGESVARAPAATSADDGDRRASALRLWQAAAPAPGSPVARYLATRGLALAEGAPIRFLAGAKHPSGRRLGAMVALLHDVRGEPAAVHRTFLRAGGEGKTDLEPQRMTLGRVAGAAVRLFPLAERLAIGEGIETSLAAAELLRMPAWAAVSAGNLGESLILPPEVREVTICADNDPPGREAARKAAARWKAGGRAVRVAMPQRDGADFNDVLLERRRNER
jgi:putative DNA primase/helicase